MGTSLTGKNISATYLGLLKTTDNAVIGGTAKIITDGNGTDSPLYLSTTRLGIGITPTSTLHVNGDANINGLTVGLGSGSITTNTAFGNNALNNNTTGYMNTAIGVSALRNNTDGDNNIAIGRLALSPNTSGIRNVALGNQSLTSNTTGSYNVGLGYDGLSGLSSGGYNIGIGYEAGNNITTGTGSIMIGGVTRSSGVTSSNEIVIGYNTTGNGSNTVTIGNSSITANHFSGKIYFGGDLSQISNNELRFYGNSGKSISNYGIGTGWVFQVSNTTSADTDVLRFYSNGNATIYKNLNLSSYGSGTITGTATQRLGVDSSGNVIEIPIGAGAVDGAGATGQASFWVDSDTISGDDDFYWDNTNKRLGIGTTSPATKLDISDGTIYSLKLSNTSAYNSGINNGIVFNGKYNSTGNTTDMASIRGGKDTTNDTDFGGKLTFHTRLNGGSDTERARIDQNGNFALGTTSADAIFHVAKANSGGVGGQIVIDNPTSSALGNAVELSFLTDIGASGSGTRNAKILAVNENVGNGAANIQFWTWNGSSEGERLRINSSGNSLFQGGINLQDSGTNKVWLTRAETILGGSDDDFVIYTETGLNQRFYTNGSERMRLDSSGNLGLGVTSPNRKLEVSSGGSDVPQIRASYDTNNYIDIKHDSINKVGGSSSLFSLQFGGSNAITINSSQNVGIGTASADNLLTISDSGGAGLEVIPQTTNDRVTLLSYDRNTSTYQTLDTDSSDVHFNISGSEKMRLDSSGTLIIKNDSSTTYGPTLQFDSQPKATWDVGDVVGEIDFFTSDTSGNAPYSAGFIKVLNETGAGTLPSGGLSFGTATYNASGGAIERARLDSSGNLNIGGTTSGAKLDIHGTANNNTLILRDGSDDSITHNAYVESTGDGAFQVYADSQSLKAVIHSNGASYFNGGNVGIGTASPSTLLHLYSSAPIIRLQDGGNWGSNATGGIEFYDQNSLMAVSEVVSGGDYNHNLIEAGNMKFLTSNTERARITSDGALLVGKTSQGLSTDGIELSTTLLRVTRSNNHPVELNRKGTDGAIINFYKDTSNVGVIGTQNWGIGTSSPATNLDIQDSSGSTDLRLRDSGDNTSLFLQAQNGINVISTVTNHPLRFDTNDTERLRITSGGEFAFGTTSNDVTGGAIYFDELGAINTYIKVGHKTGSTNGADFLACYYNNVQIGGVAQATTSTVAFNTSSDYRLKEDLQDFNALDIASKIKMYDFKWKEDDSRSYGVMAHELEEVLPQAVTGEKDGEEMQSVDYSKLVPILLKSIQELKAEIDELKKNK